MGKPRRARSRCSAGPICSTPTSASASSCTATGRSRSRTTGSSSRRARDGNEKALAELATIHPPYTSQREFALQRGWLDHYHGEIYDTERARGCPARGDLRPRVLARDAASLLVCFEHSLEALLQDRLHVDLFTTIPRLDVPVFFFAGRHDFNTPSALVEEWASRLSAPHVELVWFEGAGHFLAIEAPDEFQARLIEKLLPLAR